MAVFLQNSCKYRNCNALFSTLVELIYHIEDQHYNPNFAAEPSPANLLAPPSVIRLFCLNSAGTGSNANAYAAGRAAKQKKKTALSAQPGMDLFLQPNSGGGGDLQSPYDESLIVDEEALVQPDAFNDLGVPQPQKAMRPGEQKAPIRGEQAKVMRTGREPPRVVRGVPPRPGPMPTQQRTEMVFECADCPRTFTTDNELRAHQKAVHELPRVPTKPSAQGSVLASFLSSGSSSQTPQSVNSSAGDCLCPICNRVMKNRNALSRHMRSVHSHSANKGDDSFGASAYNTTANANFAGSNMNVQSQGFASQGNYVTNFNYVSSSATSQNYSAHSQQSYPISNAGSLQNYSVQSNVNYVPSPSPNPSAAYEQISVTEIGGSQSLTQTQSLPRRTGAVPPGARIVQTNPMKRKMQE